MKRNSASTHNQDIILKSLSDFIGRVPGLEIHRTLLHSQNSRPTYLPDLVLDFDAAARRRK